MSERVSVGDIDSEAASEFVGGMRCEMKMEIRNRPGWQIKRLQGVRHAQSAGRTSHSSACHIPQPSKPHHAMQPTNNPSPSRRENSITFSESPYDTIRGIRYFGISTE